MKRVTELLEKLTVEEKVAMCAGSGDWHTAPGRYELRVGSSSRDIRHRVQIELKL